jgi:hypothetical protein
MKRIITVLLILSIVSTALPIFAANTINVIINGESYTYDPPPRLINGNVYLPLRAACESLGITVDFNAATRTAVMTKGTNRISHVIETADIIINGTVSTFPNPSVVINGNTLVPLRMLTTAIGADHIFWDEGTQTALIITDFSEMPGTVGNVPVTTPAPTPAPAGGDTGVKWAVRRVEDVQPVELSSIGATPRLPTLLTQLAAATRFGTQTSSAPLPLGAVWHEPTGLGLVNFRGQDIYMGEARSSVEAKLGVADRVADHPFHRPTHRVWGGNWRVYDTEDGYTFAIQYSQDRLYKIVCTIPGFKYGEIAIGDRVDTNLATRGTPERTPGMVVGEYLYPYYWATGLSTAAWHSSTTGTIGTSHRWDMPDGSHDSEMNLRVAYNAFATNLEYFDSMTISIEPRDLNGYSYLGLSDPDR